jgi:signal transduction histidine kinase
VRLELSRQTDDTGSRTRFTVTDTGCGIKTEDQEQLFAAFQQIQGDGADSYEGTGLGLHISQTLATAIGAEIAFESEFGTGSTFTLELRE